MTGKELIFKTLRHEDTPRAAWVPFAGVHAGKLTGCGAAELLKDGDKLFDALLAVNKMYKPDGQPVLFDMQLEAEFLGCELVWSESGPPSVSGHPLSDEAYIPCDCCLPTAESGRLPMVLSAMRRFKKAVGDQTALYALLCGPFTLASHLRGSDIFMDMYDDPDYVKNLMDFCAKVAIRVSDLYIDAGMDVIAVVDPLISQISTDHFEEFVTAPALAIFEHIRARGSFSSFFVCGDASRNVEAMCLCRPDSISVDENISLPDARLITEKYDIAIGGNIPLTSIMLHGTQTDNMKYTVDLIDSIGSTKNLIVSPGCDMPYDVPPENAAAIQHAVEHTDEVREAVKNYIAADDGIDVELPDYSALVRPLIEVFTLDSSACAACAYMADAVFGAAAEYAGAIDAVEYKFTEKENISRCKKMGVKNLPSIYINGKLKFASIIPSHSELHAEIEKALAK